VPQDTADVFYSDSSDRRDTVRRVPRWFQLSRW